MRLIDADAAIDAVSESLMGVFVEYEDIAKKIIDKVPSAIIQCKDCTHSEHWYRDKRLCFLWHEDGIDVFDDGFCNYAERRRNAAD